MSGKDCGRFNLVTQCVCALCGRRLRLSYDRPKVTGHDFNGEHYDDGITGADKVEMPIVVYPCDSCYGEAREPIEALRNALGLLQK